MHLNKFEIFQASIIGLVLAACAIAIPAMSQTPFSHNRTAAHIDWARPI